MKDKINPDHYKGDIECIDAIKASMSKEEFLGYLKGSVMKYLWRYKYKNGLEDLRKMNWFAMRLENEYGYSLDLQQDKSESLGSFETREK